MPASDKGDSKAKRSSFVAERGTDSSVKMLVEEAAKVKEADEAKRRGRSLERRNTLPPVGNPEKEEVTDLVLILHGIGQEVSEVPF